MKDTNESTGPTYCALCERERKLCDSHIIPEFMYEPGYDELNRSIRVETETGRRKFVQKGYTEPLLCKDCEQFLNEAYEKPFHEAWYGRDLLPEPPANGDLTEMSGLNYGPFKLFHLTVLWRASVATGRFLAPTDLGPHEEPIRQMVVNDDPGDVTDYPVMGTALLHEGDLAHGLVMGPAVSKYEAMRVYWLVYGGFEWGIGVASHCPREIRDRALQTDGTMIVPVREWTESPAVRKGLRRHAAQRDDLDG